jgi:hypothetical protein
MFSVRGWMFDVPDLLQRLSGIIATLFPIQDFLPDNQADTKGEGRATHHH